MPEGDWELENVAKGEIVKIDYEISNTHKNFDWQHTGGIDEVAFVTTDGLFYVGNSLFIIPDIEAQNIRVEFSLPIGWKASTAWEKNSNLTFSVPNARMLLSNCLMLGKHQERIIRVKDFTMTLAVENKLAYAAPLLENAMKKIIPHYYNLFRGSVAKKYLVAVNEEKMNDGSAFSRSYSQIFNGEVRREGLPVWGYLMAHEIFHLWNGFAVVPEKQEEWFKEGFTDYMTILALRRTNLIDDEMLRRKMENIARRYWIDRVWQRNGMSIQETGGKKAEFRYGVYGGGALAAFALDVEIRKQTGNRKSLDDVMLKMFEKFGKSNKKYNTTDVLKVASEVGEKDFTDFFNRYITGKEWLDITPYLKECGLDYFTFAEEMYVNQAKKATTAEQNMYRKIFIGSVHFKKINK